MLKSSKQQFTTELLETRRLLSFDFNWGAGSGSLGVDTAAAVAVDDSGNVYVVGQFSGTMDVDPSKRVRNITALLDNSMFALKYFDRRLIWASVVGGTAAAPGTITPIDLSLDSRGNLFVGGSFTGSVDFSPLVSVVERTSHGGEDGFVLCLSGNTGRFAWVQQIGSDKYDAVRAVGVSHREAYVYAGGVFKNTAIFDETGANTMTSRGGKDGFLANYRTDTGRFTRFVQIGGAGEDAINDISTHEGQTSMAVCGYVEGTAEVGTRALERIPPEPQEYERVFVTSSGGKDAFHATYAPQGDPGAGKLRLGGAGVIGGPNGNELADAVEWLGGNFYVAGSFDTAFGNFTPIGGRDIFLTRPGRNQDSVIGSLGDDYVARMSIPLLGLTNGPFPLPIAGDLYLAANIRGNITMNVEKRGPTTLKGDSAGDIVIAQYGIGDSLALKQFTAIGGPAADFATGLAIDGRQATLLVAGRFAQSIDLAPGRARAILNAAGGDDWFVDVMIVL